MRTSILFFVLGSAILSIIGCKKETVNVPIPVPPVPPEILRKHIPPVAYAGEEGLAFLPADSFMLYGSGSHDTYATISCMWRKISGPSSYKINNPNSFKTTVHDLIKGEYEFELTVKDDSGSIDADTVSVIVGEMSSREISIKNIWWGYDPFFGGYIFNIENIYNLIPVGSVFKVFVYNYMTGGWEEAKGSWSSGVEDAPYQLIKYGSNIVLYTLSNVFGELIIKIVY